MSRRNQVIASSCLPILGWLILVWQAHIVVAVAHCAGFKADKAAIHAMLQYMQA